MELLQTCSFTKCLIESLMVELLHLAQSFINAENAIIDKWKKKVEWVEVGYVPHPEHGLCPKKARTSVDALSYLTTHCSNAQ